MRGMDPMGRGWVARREKRCGEFLYLLVGNDCKLLITHGRGGEVLGLNPSIRVYRYTKGQFFDCHCEFIFFSLLYITRDDNKLQTMNPMFSRLITRSLIQRL
jgi:hypothetical protein